MSFTYQRTVRFQDTDAAGVVYFANILVMCHEAYEASLEAVDINIKNFFTAPAVGFPIVHTNVDFFRPMYCGDHLEISVAPQKIGSDKFEIFYEVTVDQVLVAKAVTRHVCIETNTRSKQELPNQILNWLEVNHKSVEAIERRKSREEIL